MIAGLDNAPHFPSAAPIDAYGAMGFRFAGMSHRGSLLCLPSGIWAWPVNAPDEINADTLKGVLAHAATIDTLLIGTGTQVWLPSNELRNRFRAASVVIDTMQTGPATRVYNIMVGERRRVAAALIAVP
jgi:uncharacterized protein